MNRKGLQQALGRHRAEFTTFLKALRARTGGKQEDLFNTIDFKILFSAFPVWLVNLSDIHDILPLRQELFDLAIIDEATQCDIASCLPVLYRARRAMIVGDPNQLRHLSFLSHQRQEELIETCHVPAHQQGMCDYRDKSILDLVNENIAGQDQVVFLDEHFRSAPPIIQFSNEKFYGSALHIMTEKPGEAPASPLSLRQAEGRRGPEGDNPEEARQLINDVVNQVEREKTLASGLSHSIGILSPFRSQVDCIARHLEKALSPDAFSKHDILIGTAHTFQGEERDIMFISLALDSTSSAASLRFLEKKDVFNVSITRARIAQLVYISLSPSSLGHESLLRSYLEYIGQSALPENGSKKLPKAFRDPFLLEFKKELETRGYQIWPAYSIAGLVMDMVVTRNGQSCGIDMIGYPGCFAEALCLERYKMFRRAGFRIVPVPYSRWLANRRACLDAVERSIAAEC
jgi:superfamily I DNA and/or RNA helicase